jgi:hypothetical protein
MLVLEGSDDDIDLFLFIPNNDSVMVNACDVAWFAAFVLSVLLGGSD